MSLFGRFYRVFTFGQSHSPSFPSNFKFNLALIQQQLNRRKPGQSSISTPRQQTDLVECVSGVQNQTTLGSPLCFIVKNENIKKQDYQQFSTIPRPGHADYTYLKKYGIKAVSGGGRSSARQTIGRVIAGALAKQYLKTLNIQFASWVYSVGKLSIPEEINSTFIQHKLRNQSIEKLGIIRRRENDYLYKKDNKQYFYDPKIHLQIQNRSKIENQEFFELIPNIRCPHRPTAVHIFEQIKKIKEDQDSLGGIIQGCIYGLPLGLGQPVFDKIQAQLAHALLSIPATKGFEFGSGFEGTTMKGSDHNDLYNTDLTLKTNHSGGSLGGISTGETFEFRLAFKPVSTISKPQQTSNLQGKGRHDPCVLPRAPSIVDNMAAIVIMDLLLSQRIRE